MNYVHRGWLDYIWGSIGEDVDYPDLLLKDMKNADNFNILIQKYLKPSLDSLPFEILQLIKGTWRFTIEKYSEEILERSFESNIPPFEIPGRPREFYIKVWERLFPNESWYINDNESFFEIRDSRVDPWEWMEKSNRENNNELKKGSTKLK